MYIVQLHLQIQPIQDDIVPIPQTRFHTWGMYLIGPFPKDCRGTQNLLTCVDHLSGWEEAIPIASEKADTVHETFLNEM